MTDSGTNAAKYIGIGARRHTAVIDAPLTADLKIRLQRAAAHALKNPTTGAPTLRRYAVRVATALRACGFSDQQVGSLFIQLLQDVAQARSIDSMSLLSGQPKWMELADRMHVWAGLER